MANNFVLSLNGHQLSFSRNDQIIFENINFDVSNGQLLFIRGENGAGKTSLMKIIIGLQHDFQGAITYNQQSIGKLQESYREILLYLGHQVAINKNQTVLDNLQFYCSVTRPYVEKNIKQIILQQLEHLKLCSLSNRPCFQLSAGQQRRVALTRLFISHALQQHRLWVLDEPFVSLDQTGQHQLKQLLEQFIQNGNSVILTSHHDMGLAVPTAYLDLPEGHFKHA